MGSRPLGECDESGETPATVKLGRLAVVLDLAAGAMKNVRAWYAIQLATAGDERILVGARRPIAG